MSSEQKENSNLAKTFLDGLQYPSLIKSLPFIKAGGAEHFASAMFTHPKAFGTSADTSSGKTLGLSWLLIQLILFLEKVRDRVELCTSKYSPVVIASPQRIQCKLLCEILNKLTGDKDYVGYVIGGKESTVVPGKTKVLLTTHGWFISKLMDSQFDYNYLFHDEAHTPSSSATMTEWLGIHRYKQKIAAQQPSGLLLASATVDIQKFEKVLGSDHFTYMNVKVPRSIPNEIICDKLEPQKVLEKIQKECPEGNKIIFVDGEQTMFDLISKIHSNKIIMNSHPNIQVVPIISSLEKREIEQTLERTKDSQTVTIIVATDAIESGVTIHRVNYTISTCIRKTCTTDNVGRKQLSPQRISKSSAIQQAGRANRQKIFDKHGRQINGHSVMCIDDVEYGLLSQSPLRDVDLNPILVEICTLIHMGLDPHKVILELNFPLTMFDREMVQEMTPEKKTSFLQERMDFQKENRINDTISDLIKQKLLHRLPDDSNKLVVDPDFDKFVKIPLGLFQAKNLYTIVKSMISDSLAAPFVCMVVLIFARTNEQSYFSFIQQKYGESIQQFELRKMAIERKRHELTGQDEIDSFFLACNQYIEHWKTKSVHSWCYEYGYYPKFWSNVYRSYMNIMNSLYQLDLNMPEGWNFDDTEYLPLYHTVPGVKLNIAKHLVEVMPIYTGIFDLKYSSQTLNRGEMIHLDKYAFQYVKSDIPPKAIISFSQRKMNDRLLLSGSTMYLHGKDFEPFQKYIQDYQSNNKPYGSAIKFFTTDTVIVGDDSDSDDDCSISVEDNFIDENDDVDDYKEKNEKSPPITLPNKHVSSSSSSSSTALECCICMNAKANVLCQPCNHLSCCQSCAEDLYSCPVCRRTIQNRVEIFIAVKH